MKRAEMLLCLILLSMTGCDAFLTRPPLPESEFLARYLPEISTSAVRRLDLHQRGGVGGRLFAARVEFSNTEPLNIFKGWHQEHLLNLSADTDGIAKEYLASALRSALGPTPPSWGAAPNATNVAIYTDSMSGRHRKIFIFDSLPVVFVVAGED